MRCTQPRVNSIDFGVVLPRSDGTVGNFPEADTHLEAFLSAFLSAMKIKCVTELSWRLQQRINIHFCVKMGWTFDEIKAGLQTVYPQTLSDSSIRTWIREFWAGRNTIVDKKRTQGQDWPQPTQHQEGRGSCCARPQDYHQGIGCQNRTCHNHDVRSKSH